MNYLELLTAWLMLKTFCSSRQKQIQLQLDNTTAMAYNNDQEGKNSRVMLWHGTFGSGSLRDKSG